MIFLNNNCHDPYLNHALEEYFLKYTNEDCFILWRNKPSILIGKNQNTLKEINLDYVKEHNIEIVRRVSGGGTVFNDLGNLNYTFITKKEGNFANFKVLAKPVLNSLKKLGVDAEFSGRNDLIVDGKKFCGNAQYAYKNRVLHHGTLLFDSDLENLHKALNVNKLKFKDKSVKSCKSRVCNIRDFIFDRNMNVEEFKNFLIEDVMAQYNVKKFYELGEEDLKKVKEIADNKYRTWQWNYGSSPNFNFFNEDKFSCGLIQISIDIKEGIIRDIKINGDFFGKKDIAELEEVMKGARYEEKVLRECVDRININEFINNINKEEFIKLMFNY
ncbi:lipoate--protein ligase [Haloimpatiens sp. FM7315]|uniref:lipoate--protein ligase n=1 Tax=Haloimpatiens sp. FM7315 TaxID=3298609 RepID=UPI00370B2878